MFYYCHGLLVVGDENNKHLAIFPFGSVIGAWFSDAQISLTEAQTQTRD